MIERIRLLHYKGFQDCTVRFGAKNVLVGPNNAGKSTIIAALRLGTVLLQHARHRNVLDLFPDKDRQVPGHLLSAVSANRELPDYVTENVRHELNEDTETRVTIELKGGARIECVWPMDESSSPYFYLEKLEGMPIRDVKAARSLPIAIGVAPMLGPINAQEELLTEKYVSGTVGTRLSSSHFRNQLHYLTQEDLHSYIDYVMANTPEISGLRMSSEIAGYLDLFVTERTSRVEKELFWTGDGLHIWLQILYYLHVHKDAGCIVLDEPDVFLHPDLQRRLVAILEAAGLQTIMATHAPEILAESSRDSVIWIDRTRRSARRAREKTALDSYASALGSGFDLSIARALRSKIALFVEGQDMQVLRNLAKTIGATKVQQERDLTVIPLNGFTNWTHVEPFSWIAKDLLGGSVKIFVILDRDYRSDTQIYDVEARLSSAGVESHVWRRKELESYLLAATAIARVSGADTPWVEQHLKDATDGLSVEVQANYLSERVKEHYPDDAKKTHMKAIPEFEKAWSNDQNRIKMVPPKEVLHALNKALADAKLNSISARKLSVRIRRDEIPDEAQNLLQRIESLL